MERRLGTVERGPRAGLKKDGCEHWGMETTFTVGAEESDTQYLSRSCGSHKCCLLLWPVIYCLLLLALFTVSRS